MSQPEERKDWLQVKNNRFVAAGAVPRVWGLSVESLSMISGRIRT